MFGIPLDTLFMAVALVCFVLGAFHVTILDHSIGWYGLAAACLCGAWLAGGEIFR